MIIYQTIQDRCYFHICISGFSCLAVVNIDLPIIFVPMFLYTLKDSEVLLPPINKISHSKKALISYGRVQGFTIELSAVCLCGLYGQLDTLFHL